MAEPEPEPRPHLLSLPAEIREHIYRLILHPDANRVQHEDDYFDYNFGPALVLFRINRQIYLEARKIFRDLNIFVRIETPWPQAEDHLRGEGHVPIVVAHDKALDFKDHSLTVGILPPVSFQLYATQRFIIMADDIKKFTRMWFYADLSNPGLNEHLKLVLELRDPYTPEWEEKHMPKWLQKKLLMPFGEVKNLDGMEIGGDIKPFGTIEKDLREVQRQPQQSPEHCLREATRLKFEGNAELMKGNYEAALKIYNEAWTAIHVVVKGRQRHIHGDEFFSKYLVEEPYKGKNGQAERLLLRVHLVANTCLLYLKMENYELCHFWGMRTISMLRESMQVDARQSLPEEEAVLGFPAADQMGKIYYRTALACKHFDDMIETRRLLKVAEVYLPNDQSVKKEIEATRLKLG